MNAISENRWTQHLRALGKSLARPSGIVVISAHWSTRGTRWLASPRPRTIHDFYGFPEALYEIQYPADGLSLANFANDHIEQDTQWGLDHGSWSVLKHLYPAADIPVTQLSLSESLTLDQHFALGEELRSLREAGYLLIGSGNLTHNLRALDFSERAKAQDWALEFDHLAERALMSRDRRWLTKRLGQDALWQQAHPTLEHYLPLLYIAGSAFDDEVASFPFTEIHHGSLSMRTVVYAN